MISRRTFPGFIFVANFPADEIGERGKLSPAWEIPKIKLRFIIIDEMKKGRDGIFAGSHAKRS